MARGAPRINLERQTLPKQTIYHWKGNLMKSRTHFKYWENIFISRSYESLSRFWSNLGYFERWKKFLKCEQFIYHLKVRDLEMPRI